ncbi:MAG: DUF2510 domain-containing protein, partial [Actinomycetota bacterium]
MSDVTGNPPAGWYHDPSAPEQQRWWDGATWTSSIRPLRDTPPPALPPPTADPNPFDPSPFAASVGAAPTGTPAQQQTPGQPGTPATGPDGRPGGRSIGTAGRVAIAVAGLLTVGGCAVVVGLAAGDDDNDRNGDGQATTDVVEEDTSPATVVGAVGSGGDPADTDVDSAVGDGTDGT